jgi:hypothetical protein
MSKSRIRKAEAILSKLRAKDAPALPDTIVYTSEADCERQLAALEAKGHKGRVVCLPDNGRSHSYVA